MMLNNFNHHQTKDSTRRLDAVSATLSVGGLLSLSLPLDHYPLTERRHEPTFFRLSYIVWPHKLYSTKKQGLCHPAQPLFIFGKQIQALHQGGA